MCILRLDLYCTGIIPDKFYPGRLIVFDAVNKIKIIMTSKAFGVCMSVHFQTLTTQDFMYLNSVQIGLQPRDVIFFPEFNFRSDDSKFTSFFFFF